MTRYAVYDARNLLLAAWSIGAGYRSSAVAELPRGVAARAALDLVYALSNLSEVLWYRYAYPASAALTLQVNTEGWRRQEDRDAFAKVIPAVLHPQLPNAEGLIELASTPVEERAHQLGLLLHEICHPELTGDVAADVTTELNAVEQEECGDFSGRACQALALTRAEASPTQVATGWPHADG